MSLDAQQLFALLPSIYRLRDAGQGGPLQALLSVVAGQIAALEENLAQLYDDQFIETCASWVVPYIGDLVGYRQVYALPAQIRSPRAEVANTIGFRRRKGTASVLEQLAQEVTGWDATVVEFFQRLAVTQNLNHLRLAGTGTIDVRFWECLERLNTAFDCLGHTVDVRGIANEGGRYNIPNVGVFLWRLGSYALDHSPAFKIDNLRYLFSPVGSNTPLFGAPGIPAPIGRRMLSAHLGDYYGPGKSFSIDGVTDPGGIVVCDLSDLDSTGATWAHSPPAGKIAVDPVLGRISFASAPSAPPSVSFHYGFSSASGGGQYNRAAPLDTLLQPVAQVPSPHATIQDALTAVTTGGAVEVTNSGRYSESPAIHLAAANARVELRAANLARPALALGGEFQISGPDTGEVTLNGLLITGGPLHVVTGSDGKALQRLRLLHCTLVPGVILAVNGSPQQPGAPSLIVEAAGTQIEIDHCIVGGIRAAAGAQVSITDSIVDATSETGTAYAALDGSSAGGPLQIQNSTMIGKVRATIMQIASNTLFVASLAPQDTWTAPVLADRRQSGCVRFCYLPPAARVPRRYRCQPDLSGDPAAVHPIFTSERYGDPGYCQLSRRTAVEIRQGADDGSEMGAFHELFQMQREGNLQARLDEYLRFGLEAGFFYCT
jgi:hypothetical protein